LPRVDGRAGTKPARARDERPGIAADDHFPCAQPRAVTRGGQAAVVRTKSGKGSVSGQAARLSRWYRPTLELLESRLPPATIPWTNAAGSWAVAANWDLNRTPTIGDDVVIPNLGPNLTITYSSGATTAYDFNDRGLLAEVVDPLGNATHYAYDSNFNLTRLT